MDDLKTTILALTEEQRAGALIVLDALTRPLTKREIEGAMIGKGVSRTQRKIIASAIEPLHIIALVGAEPHG